jgi:hypothetical protein
MMEWPAILFLACLIIAIQSIAAFNAKQRLAPDVLVVGGNSKDDIKKNRSRFVHDGKSMVLEGYKMVRPSTSVYQEVTDHCLQTKDGKFYIPSNLGERLMLPVKYLEDLKNAPVDKVDFVATFFEVNLSLGLESFAPC